MAEAPAAEAPAAEAPAAAVKAFPSKRNLERALRGAGLTTRQAKKLLALGYAGIADAGAPQDLDALALQAEILAQHLRSACTENPRDP